MTYSFRPAARENVGLLIALAGASGSGKTFSAMRLAAGIVGPGNRFAVIDTEARRALHYADRFPFDHCELRAPFRPDAYADAVKAAETYRAVVIDSMSHEWAGEGGVLDWQETELERMAGQDWAKRERVKLAAWIKPKMAHKAMVQRLLQSRAHVIFCLRAEEKVEMVRGADGKTQIVPKGYQPICAKDFMFEMTASFLLTPDKPGLGQPIKLQEQHKALFPAGEQIGEEAGRRLSAWASGAASAVASNEPPKRQSVADWGAKILLAVHDCRTLGELDAVRAKVTPALPKYREMLPEKADDLMALIATKESELRNAST